MIHLSLLLVGFLLGVFAVGILFVLMVVHRPRHVAPTMHNRNRGRLPEVGHEPPPMPVCKAAKDAEVGGIEYRFMGQTGYEE